MPTLPIEATFLSWDNDDRVPSALLPGLPLLSVLITDIDKISVSV